MRQKIEATSMSMKDQEYLESYRNSNLPSQSTTKLLNKDVYEEDLRSDDTSVFDKVNKTDNVIQKNRKSSTQEDFIKNSVLGKNISISIQREKMSRTTLKF